MRDYLLSRIMSQKLIIGNLEYSKEIYISKDNQNVLTDLNDINKSIADTIKKKSEEMGKLEIEPQYLNIFKLLLKYPIISTSNEFNESYTSNNNHITTYIGEYFLLKESTNYLDISKLYKNLAVSELSENNVLQVIDKIIFNAFGGMIDEHHIFSHRNDVEDEYNFYIVINLDVCIDISNLQELECHYIDSFGLELIYFPISGLKGSLDRYINSFNCKLDLNGKDYIVIVMNHGLDEEEMNDIVKELVYDEIPKDKNIYNLTYDYMYNLYHTM